MKKTYFTFIVSTTLLLSSCLGPQTYFSEVFNIVKDTYGPVQDNNDRPVMNYHLSAEVINEGKTYTYEVGFFETGLKLMTETPTVKDDIDTTQYLTILYDYSEDGMFIDRRYESTPDNIEKIFQAFSDDSFNLFEQAFSVYENFLTPDIVRTLNNQATNLIIGGQPVANEVKVYNLPIANFIDFNSLEDVAGFVPNTVSAKVTFTGETLLTIIELNASNEEKTYQITLTLSNPGSLLETDFLLDSSTKNLYEGYAN
jgi:hypothetical protein